MIKKLILAFAMTTFFASTSIIAANDKCNQNANANSANSCDAVTDDASPTPTETDTTGVRKSRYPNAVTANLENGTLEMPCVEIGEEVYTVQMKARGNSMNWEVIFADESTECTLGTETDNNSGT